MPGAKPGIFPGRAGKANGRQRPPRAERDAVSMLQRTQQVGAGQAHLPLAGGGEGQLLRQPALISAGQGIPVGPKVGQQPVQGLLI